MANTFEFKGPVVDKSLNLQYKLLMRLLEKNGVTSEKENDFCLKWIEEFSADFRCVYEGDPNISLEDMERKLLIRKKDRVENPIRFNNAA